MNGTVISLSVFSPLSHSLYTYARFELFKVCKFIFNGPVRSSMGQEIVSHRIEKGGGGIGIHFQPLRQRLAFVNNIEARDIFLTRLY